MKIPLKYRLAGLALLCCSTAQAAPIDLPDIPQCTELLPGAISIDSTPVTLSLRVVLDGVSQAQAAPVVADVLRSYAPLDITLSVGYDSANFSSSNGLELIEELKRFYGGTRPAGTQLVFALTSKNLTDGSVVGDSLAGQADCIGGVTDPAHAFAVGEFDPDFAAKTMAHELGHLLGGQHHYANCVEALIGGGDNLCTLMFNDVGFASLPFSTLNGLVVRGHAQVVTVAGTPAGGATNSNSPPEAGNGASSSGSGGGSLSWLSLGLLLVAPLLRQRRRSQL